MSRLFGPNWKTTFSGVLSALFAFVLFSPEQFVRWPWIIALAKFALAGGLLTLGISAKDNNVAGGTKPNV